MKLITSKIYYKYSEILTNALRTLVYELFLEIFYEKMIKQLISLTIFFIFFIKIVSKFLNIIY